jgi:hypothetical protein
MEGTLLKHPIPLRKILMEHGYDVELIKDFLQEAVEANRETDRLLKDSLGKAEFYKREMRYTQIDRLLDNLNK